MKRLLGVVLAILAGLLRRRPREAPEERPPEEDVVVERETGGGGEPLVAALLALSSVASIAFVVVLLGWPDPQREGLALFVALGALAAALIVAARRVAPRELAVEARPGLHDPAALDSVEAELRAGGERVSRRRLLTAAGIAAGGSLAAAIAVPAASLGPAVGDSPSQSAWRRGRRLVGEDGRPLSVDDVGERSFLTAFPEGADKRELGSPVVVVRVDPATLRLPRQRAGWAPQGILAYSKICTHAGCAIALYRSPLHEPTSNTPALACPCHYSAFDVRRAAKVIAGPAGRPLPQLPLMLGEGGALLAAGPLSGPVGPAWWGLS